MRDTNANIRGRTIHGRPSGILRPFEGWSLDALGELDRLSPGLLLHAFNAGPKWRQAVFLVLAFNVPSNPFDYLVRANGEHPTDRPWQEIQTAVAQSLIAMTPKQITQACLGEIPDGLAGCLAKLGSQPMRSADDYLRLVNLLTSDDPDTKLRAKTLIQLDRLDADLLAAVLELDEIALTPTLLLRICDGVAARRLNKKISAIKLVCSAASDEALRQSLNNQPNGHGFAESWIAKADRPPVVHEPLDLHSDFERVTPESATTIGKEFSNCLRHKTGQLVSGVWGAWVWKPGRLIATVTSCVEGPLLTGIYAHGNRQPHQEHVHLLKDLLRHLGVICFTRKDVSEEIEILTQGEFSRFVLDEEFE
tara:strand:- start:90 stop:1181 length:1092 start_codon:yes stop_codon:yes gene_type:complete